MPYTVSRLRFTVAWIAIVYFGLGFVPYLVPLPAKLRRVGFDCPSDFVHRHVAFARGLFLVITCSLQALHHHIIKYIIIRTVTTTPARLYLFIISLTIANCT